MTLNKNSFPRKISNAALCVAAPLIVLLSIEFLAGAVYSDIKVFYNLHPEYLYVTKADFKRSFLNKYTGQDILFRTSHLGYRGNFGLEKTRPRVVVYGDSNVQALFFGEQETFPVKLENALKNAGKDFEVINAGTTGYGPDQNLLRMQKEIPVLKPDVIIFQMFADNDFGDLIRNKIFDVKDRKLVKRNPKPAFKIKAEYYCAKSYICRELRKRALKINRAGREPDLRKLCELEFGSYKRDDIVDFPMWEDHYDADIGFSQRAPSSQHKIELMKRLIEEIKRVSAMHPEIRMFLLILPAKSELLSGRDVQPFSVDMLELAAQKAGMDYLNLYAPFMQAGPQNMYNAYDDHWGPGGVAIAADLSAEKILNLQNS